MLVADDFESMSRVRSILGAEIDRKLVNKINPEVTKRFTSYIHYSQYAHQAGTSSLRIVGDLMRLLEKIVRYKSLIKPVFGVYQRSAIHAQK